MKRQLFFSLIFLAFGAFLFGNISFASGGTYGLDATAQATDLAKYGKDVPALIGNVIGTALSLVSVVFFILAVYGGFRMMLARGKEDEFTKGRDVLIHAVIGLIVILASYAITTFMFNSVGVGSGSSGGDDKTPAAVLTPNCLSEDGNTCSPLLSPQVECSFGPVYESFDKCKEALGAPTADPGEVGGACETDGDCVGDDVLCSESKVCVADDPDEEDPTMCTPTSCDADNVCNGTSCVAIPAECTGSDIATFKSCVDSSLNVANCAALNCEEEAAPPEDKECKNKCGQFGSEGGCGVFPTECTWIPQEGAPNGGECWRIDDSPSCGSKDEGPACDAVPGCIWE